VSSVRASLICSSKIDLEGYEVEIAFEFAKPVYPRSPKIHAYHVRPFSYSDLSKVMLDTFSRKP
jgi:hypothetical protein